MKINSKIAVVVPVYQAGEIIDELCVRVINNLSKITDKFEIILVDDSSSDNSWVKIKENSLKDHRIKGIKLSRNFGQHYAITAGLQHAKGEWTVVMDCDLQDRPDEIINLYDKALEGYDLVVAQRISRQDSFLKQISSKIFYRLFSYLTNTNQNSSVANFGIYKRKVIEAVLSMGDSVRAFPMLVQWVGFHKYELPVIHGERTSGKSTYTFFKLIQLAFNVIIAFSQKPLRLILQLGLMICLLTFTLGIFFLYQYFSGQIKVPGYASIIVSIWFLGGIIISILGGIGLYLGRVYSQVKNRPLYIISKKENFDE